MARLGDPQKHKPALMAITGLVWQFIKSMRGRSGAQESHLLPWAQGLLLLTVRYVDNPQELPLLGKVPGLFMIVIGEFYGTQRWESWTETWPQHGRENWVEMWEEPTGHDTSVESAGSTELLLVRVQAECVPSEAQGVAAKPRPDNQVSRERQDRAQSNCAMPALQPADGIFIAPHHEVGIVCVTIRLQCIARLEIRSRGFSGYKAIVVHLSDGLSKDCLKLFWGVQLQRLSQNSAVADIHFEVGSI
ncbi:hypothetical protein DFH07DRAFT_772310 [Mycena maculata]|uniref:Uncharacterized protein n=1 Tax=Mycena maculata TaxID=230809 RepID=A0AAD7NFM5_9AGAR|nr:hypothetical protein DFH07DRAFT_772310 [Mycena maculata]